MFVKILHILAFTSWMAGLFYLPRIFVYHAEKGPKGSEVSEVFKVMEKKLFRFIMTPAMIVTWGTGIYLSIQLNYLWSGGVWIWAKAFFVALLTWFHFRCGVWVDVFQRDKNEAGGRFFRVVNEVPTLVFIGIVSLVVWRPF